MGRELARRTNEAERLRRLASLTQVTPVVRKIVENVATQYADRVRLRTRRTRVGDALVIEIRGRSTRQSLAVVLDEHQGWISAIAVMGDRSRRERLLDPQRLTGEEFARVIVGG